MKQNYISSSSSTAFVRISTILFNVAHFPHPCKSMVRTAVDKVEHFKEKALPRQIKGGMETKTQFFFFTNTSACLYVRGRTCVAVRAKKIKTFKPRARNNHHPGRSYALAWPYVHGRTCMAIRACPYMRAHTCVAIRAKYKK